MQLYGRRSSINVQKVLWCLAELGLTEGRDYQRIDAGLHFGVVDTPEFLALNPNGLVPTLIDDTLVLWESNSIVRYLAAKHGDGTLLPTDLAARADVERWMDWQLATLWATTRIAFLGLTRTPEPQRNYDAIRAAYRDAGRLLGFVDNVLSKHEYIAQDRFTAADIVIGLSAHRWVGLREQFPDALDAPPPMPSLKRWLKRVTERTGFAAAVAV